MLKDKINNLPDNCGVYLFKNKLNEIIYIGKAISIKKRIKGHFNSANTSIKQKFLVDNINDIDYIITNNEVEALLLESNLIKKHSPKFNIRLKDDKRYPYLTITLNEKYPRLIITRKPSYTNKSFGPFLNGSYPKKIIDLAQKIFKLHKCRKPEKNRNNRPCLNFDINLCDGVCFNKVDTEKYDLKVKKLTEFLKGEVDGLIKEYKFQMNEYSKSLEFEKAIECRDIISSLESLSIKQFTEKSSDYNYDIIAINSNQNSFSIVKMLIRDGKVLGKEDFSDTIDEIYEEESILEEYLRKEYEFNDFIPKEILLNKDIDNRVILENWLSEKVKYKVKIIFPKRGTKRKFLDLAKKNSENLLKIQEQKFIDKNKIIYDLKQELKLRKLPYYIETFDISNYSGKENVASMVVCKNGRMIKKLYRKYIIKTVSGQDDFLSMYEVVHRRYSRLLKEKQEMPDLIIVDGGKGQVSSAQKALYSLKIFDADLIGIAKKEEIIFKPEMKDGIILNQKSDLIKFIQIIRNEAHRFAISFHKKIRDKKLSQSELDRISGIGFKKKIDLLNYFGSVEKIKYASIEELTKIKGINRIIAQRIKKELF